MAVVGSPPIEWRADWAAAAARRLPLPGYRCAELGCGTILSRLPGSGGLQGSSCLRHPSHGPHHGNEFAGYLSHAAAAAAARPAAAVLAKYNNTKNATKYLRKYK